MTTQTRPNGIAPSTTRYKVGAKGGRVAQAWQHIWDQLDRTTYRDSKVLADEAARRFQIKPISIISHLHRMAAEGILEGKALQVDAVVTRRMLVRNISGAVLEPRQYQNVQVANRRSRTHYRIAAGK